MSVNSRLTAIQIIGQSKAFYNEGILESSCARKETVDIDNLVTSRNDDKKIMHSIRKATLKIPSHSVLLGRFLPSIFSKNVGFPSPPPSPSFFVPPPLLEILSLVTHFTDPHSKMQKSSFPCCETFKLLL